MVTDEQFPLYDLFWWQNPWQVLLYCGAAIFVYCILTILLWLWHHRCRRSPQEMVLVQLQQLLELCRQGSIAVPDAYARAVNLVKQFAVLEGFVSTIIMTDREFIIALSGQKSAFSDLFPVLCSLCEHAEIVKFAGNVCDESSDIKLYGAAQDEAIKQIQACVHVCWQYLAYVRQAQRNNNGKKIIHS